MDIKVGILLLLVSGSVIEAVPTLTPQPTAPDTGSTLTLTCELLAGFTTALMSFDKDGATLYTCGIGGQTCDDSNGVSDYSEVDWSQTNKGIITIYNADQSRDGGDWTCTVGSGGGTSLPVTLAITAIPTTTATTTTTTDTPTPSADTKGCFSQAGCTAGVVLGSIYGTSWLVAIVVNLVIYCMNQMLLAWNLCDGPMKRLWIWILLFIFLPYIPSVISIYLFRTNRPAKKPTSGMELEKNGTP